MKQMNFILFLFLITLTSAAPSLQLQYEKIQPGETILGLINTTGNFTQEIFKEDIKFFKGKKEIFFNFDIKGYLGGYLFYADTNNEGNFTIKISNILYEEGGVLKEGSIIKNISISNELKFDKDGNTTKTEILKITPGIVSSFSNPSIKLINLGESSLNITYEKNKIFLNPLEEKEIFLNPLTEFSYATFSTYKTFSIPIIYFGLNSSLNGNEILNLKSNPDHVSTETIVNEKNKYSLSLFNFIDENITKIEITSDISFLKIDQIEKIVGKEIYNLTMEFSPTKAGYFRGNLQIIYTQKNKIHNLTIPLGIFALPAGSLEEDFKIGDESCAEKNGKVCNSNQKCDGAGIFTKGAVYCCLSSCIQDKSSSKDSEGGSGKIIGIIIFIALAGGGYYLYKRSKKVTPKKPEEKIKESSNEFSKRMSEKRNESKRISGSLKRS